MIVLYMLEKYFRGMALIMNVIPLCHPVAKLYWSVSRQLEIYRLFKKAQAQASEIFQSFEQAFNEMEKNKNESD